MSVETSNTLHECMCRFCGQVLQASDKAWKEAHGDQELAAKLTCDCKEAKIFRRRREKLLRAADVVDRVAGKASGNPVAAEVIGMLHKSVAYIVDYKIKGITIAVSEREKIQLKATKKGIDCTREKKKTDTDSVEF